MKKYKNSILAGTLFGLIFGTFQAFSNGINYAIISGPISGLLFGIAIYLFVNSKIFKRQTQIETNDDENIIHSGGANHFINGEAVGGRLFLLTDKLKFKSHNFNLQNHEISIYIREILDITYYNTLGIIPNGIKILQKDGKHEKFVVSERRQWKSEIEKIKILNNT